MTARIPCLVDFVSFFKKNFLSQTWILQTSQMFDFFYNLGLDTRDKRQYFISNRSKNT